MTANLCLVCKGGRALCGQERCPLLAKLRVEPKFRKNLSKEFFGPSMNIFVGRIGYPTVNVGPLAAIEERTGLDSPEKWFGMDYSDIVELRSLMLRSKQGESIYSKTRFVSEVQELAMSSRPVDTEILFKKLPRFRMSFSDVYQPMGASAPLDKLRITENPKIPMSVERIAGDELRANEASFLFYKRGQDVHRITAILSSGILGYRENQKLVPTRWSITAVDDIIAKHIMEGIRTYRSINSFMVYESQYLDNHFVILLMPGSWEFENFEAWSPGSMWSQNLKKAEIIEEYEPFRGRASYAEKQGGGYYASRISLVEALEAMKRQARAVVFREVYEGYVIPLGVWVVRETAREAFRKKPMVFATKEEALNYVDSRLKLPLEDYVRQSKILRQRRLSDYSQ